jgi:putative redox protein
MRIGKGWPLQGVTVRLRHTKLDAQDCAEYETRVGRIDQIERQIALAAPLDASQRQRLLEIAEMCPVHRTLQAEVHITSTLV